MYIYTYMAHLQSQSFIKHLLRLEQTQPGVLSHLLLR